MPLEVQLRAERTDLLYQQSPPAHVVLSNTEKNPLEILNPLLNANMPIMRVIEARTGIEVLQQQKGRMSGDLYTPLDAGQRIEHTFPLLSKVSFAVPSDYEVSAILVYDRGVRRAESNTLKFKIQPVTPRNFTYVYGQGGWASGLYGVCINATADPPQILRYFITPRAGGGVTDVQEVAKGDLRTVPFLSAAQNQSVAHTHWVAWLSGLTLHFTHINAVEGALPPRTLDLPALEAAIVPPLHIDTSADATQRPAGTALLWMRDAANAAAMQIVGLPPAGRAGFGARTPVPGPRPVWMMSHERSDGSRLVTYVQPTASGIGLFTLPWPDQAIASNPLRRLAEWKCQFIAGGATMSRDNVIHGATLTLTASSWRVEIARWTIDPKGQFAETGRDLIPWTFAVPVPNAIVRVDASGLPAALLQDHNGRWFAYDPRLGIAPAPGAMSVSKLPMELTFMDIGRPVLIAGAELRGFQVLQWSGEPLASRPG